MTMQTKPDTHAAAGEAAQPSDAQQARQAAFLREQLSALADGHGPSVESSWSGLCQAYAEDPQLRQAWSDYHWLGEALRAGDHAPAPADTAFVAQVMARIASEDSRSVKPHRITAQPVTVVQPEVPAANDAIFRWKMVAGVATLAAVVAVAWQVAVVPQSGPQLAQAISPAAPTAPVVQLASGEPSRAQAVITERGVVLRDPQLEELLAAHRQYGGMSALQMPAGFLRNATYETPQR